MENDKQKLGFELGWDFGSYSLLPPESMRALPSFMSGFKEGKGRQLHHTHDRFIRKWLTLRANALTRDRVFDPAVTPAFIRYIDSDVCPITEVKLTHGTMTGTDWSVDRINNDGAYAVGNLIVVSSEANSAKSSYRTNRIEGIIRDGGSVCGLTNYQWQRWLQIMSMVDARQQGENVVMGYGLVPCIIIPPRGIPANPSIVLQIEIARAATKAQSVVLDTLPRLISKDKRRAANALIRDVEKKIDGLRNCLDVWLNQRLFNQFVDFHESLGEETLGKILTVNSGKKGSVLKNMDNFNVEALALDSKGYRPAPAMG